MSKYITPFTFEDTVGTLTSNVQWNYPHRSFQGSSSIARSGPKCSCTECDYERLDADILSTMYSYSESTDTLSDNEETQEPLASQRSPPHSPTIAPRVTAHPNLSFSTSPSNQQICNEGNQNRRFGSLPVDSVLPPALDRKRKRAQVSELEEDNSEIVSVDTTQTQELPKPKKARVQTAVTPLKTTAKTTKTLPRRQKIPRNSVTTGEGPSRIPIDNLAASKTTTRKGKTLVKCRVPKQPKASGDGSRREAKESQKRKVRGAKEESRRSRVQGRKNIMNKDVRRMAMEDDPCSGEVEPHRVWCLFCDKWVKTDGRSEYYPDLWEKHVNRAWNHKEEVNRLQKHWNVDEFSISVQQALLDIELSETEELE